MIFIYATRYVLLFLVGERRGRNRPLREVLYHLTVGYDRTDNEGRPQAELSDTGDDVDIALREPQLVLQRIGEKTKRITERQRGEGGERETPSGNPGSTMCVGHLLFGIYSSPPGVRYERMKCHRLPHRVVQELICIVPFWGSYSEPKGNSS